MSWGDKNESSPSRVATLLYRALTRLWLQLACGQLGVDELSGPLSRSKSRRWMYCVHRLMAKHGLQVLDKSGIIQRRQCGELLPRNTPAVRQRYKQ